MVRRFSLIGLLIVLPTGVAAQHASPEDAVRDFHASLVAGDSAGVVALLDPAVVIFEGGGVEASRDEYASHHLGSDMAFAAATTRESLDTRSAVYGELAMVLNHSRVTGTFRDRPIDLVSTETMLLRWTEDGWRIVHIHWSSRRHRSEGG